jgi:phosphatidylinositol alpha 1,6-mannosyltransferase
MAAGLPVVAAAAGGPSELITSGVDGILTTPGDPHELATALRALKDDSALRARLASAGRVRSREFTPTRTVEQLLIVYEGIMGRR